MLKQFEQSDLFVLACEIAANGDRDGIPNVLVEALAMGVPSLSTTVSAVPEILLNRISGITVSPGDATIMAEAIENILTNRKLRETIIQGGREHTSSNFNNRTLVAQLGDIFAPHLHQ